MTIFDHIKPISLIGDQCGVTSSSNVAQIATYNYIGPMRSLLSQCSRRYRNTCFKGGLFVNTIELVAIWGKSALLSVLSRVLKSPAKEHN